MKISRTANDLRWGVLAAALAGTVFSNLADYLPLGKKFGEVAAQHLHLFMPAQFAFSMWAVIYFSMIIYAIYQLLPAQQDKLLYDHLARPFIAVHLLGIAWLLAFKNDYTGLSLGISLLLAVVSGNMVTRVRHARTTHPYSTWLHVPFSLFSGWMVMMSLLNADVWIAVNGLQQLFSASAFAAVWIVIALLYGAVRCTFYRDAVYGLVVSWTLVAVSLHAQHLDKQTALVAMVAGITSLVWVAGYSIKRHVLHREASPRYNGRWVMKVVR